MENNITSGKRCLLLYPEGFYSFEKNLADELRLMNYQVQVIHDLYPTTIWGKLMSKFNVPVIYQSTYRALSKILANDENYDLILIIRGRGINMDSINLLKQKLTESGRIIGFNWDSFSNNKHPLKWYDKVDRFYTFDYGDAEKYNIPILETFSAVKPAVGNREKKYTFCAIVSNHSTRLEYIEKIRSIFPNENFFIYIYEKNIFSLMSNAVRNPYLWIKFRKFIHTTSLSYSEYSRIMEESVFTIDFCHYKQTGITLRCFEASSYRTKIITNNKYIFKNPLFDNSNVIWFPLDGNKEDLISEVTRLKGTTTKQDSRTVRNFIDDFIK